ncbi:MAG: hypothetical protein HON90_17765, partial [Halobacteriovoraceae bacterium]|nr:hypothetical protein [Halobacteriovoraceae bacterium]
LFKNKDSQLVITQQAYDGVCFKIFLSQDSSRGNAHKNHFLFINDRFIQDIKLHKIILNAASSLWPEGETGHYVAYLDIPSDEVDVNIHPNKTVVKLFKAPRVFSIISGTIRHELTSRQQLHTAASPKASELPLEVSTDSFSNVEYRPVDFSMKDQVEDYFDNIHQQPHPSLDKPSESGLVFDFHDYSLYKINDHLFILNKEKILIYHLMKILCSQSLKENAVPLLVSRPIKVSQKVQTQTNDFLQSLGFEIDHLDATTVAVRTFPKDLQSYPYLEIIEYLLEHKISSFDQLDFSHFKFNTYNNSLISDILSKIAITELIEQNILQQMTQDQIKKYYAK